MNTSANVLQSDLASVNEHLPDLVSVDKPDLRAKCAHARPVGLENKPAPRAVHAAITPRSVARPVSGSENELTPRAVHAAIMPRSETRPVIGFENNLARPYRSHGRAASEHKPSAEVNSVATCPSVTQPAQYCSPRLEPCPQLSSTFGLSPDHRNFRKNFRESLAGANSHSEPPC